jgi:hypothetical protein
MVNGVKVVKTDRGRTLYGIPLCKPYILRKINQQISRRVSAKGTYPFKYIHFNIIIEEDGFNGDTYIAYFWCNYIKYYRAFPIKNHKQETLLPLFKSIIAFTKKFNT